jgi:hypothetical protein
MKTTVPWVSCDFPFSFFGFCADSGMEPTSDNAKASATSRLMLFFSPNILRVVCMWLPSNDDDHLLSVVLA